MFRIHMNMPSLGELSDPISSANLISAAGLSINCIYYFRFLILTICACCKLFRSTYFLGPSFDVFFFVAICLDGVLVLFFFYSLLLLLRYYYMAICASIEQKGACLFRHLAGDCSPKGSSDVIAFALQMIYTFSMVLSHSLENRHTIELACWYKEYNGSIIFFGDILRRWLWASLLYQHLKFEETIWSWVQWSTSAVVIELISWGNDAQDIYLMDNRFSILAVSWENVVSSAT